MEVFTAFAGELERSIAWGSGGFTTLRGAVARLQRKKLERSIAWGSGGFTTLGGAVARLQRGVSPISPASVST